VEKNVNYNEDGHICPDTGRIAMTIAVAYAREDSTDRTFYIYSPSAAELGLECWRMVDGFDSTQASPKRYDVHFSDGGRAEGQDGFGHVYMQRTKAQREAGTAAEGITAPVSLVLSQQQSGRIDRAAPVIIPVEIHQTLSRLILNTAQAKAVYDAMCALNNVGVKFLPINFPRTSRGQRITLAAANEGVVVTSYDNQVNAAEQTEVEEYHDTQAAFAAAYGLN
jgi:hypothetical protein